MEHGCLLWCDGSYWELVSFSLWTIKLGCNIRMIGFFFSKVWVCMREVCAGKRSLMIGVDHILSANLIFDFDKSLTQITWNLVCPELLHKLCNRFEILHRARWYHCNALCKNVKAIGNWHWCYVRTKFREIEFKMIFGRISYSHSILGFLAYRLCKILQNDISPCIISWQVIQVN